MSKAFTKEAEGGDVYDDLPDRPVSPHNLVTPKGLELIEAELARLHEEHAAAQEADDKARLAKINRDLRYWTSRRATAQVVEPPRDAKRGAVRLDGDHPARGRAPPDLSHRRRGRGRPFARHALLRVAGGPGADGASRSATSCRPASAKPRSSLFPEASAPRRSRLGRLLQHQLALPLAPTPSPCWRAARASMGAAPRAARDRRRRRRVPVVVCPSRLARKSRWSPAQSSFSTTNFSPKVERTFLKPACRRLIGLLLAEPVGDGDDDGLGHLSAIPLR